MLGFLCNFGHLEFIMKFCNLWKLCNLFVILDLFKFWKILDSKMRFLTFVCIQIYYRLNHTRLVILLGAFHVKVGESQYMRTTGWSGKQVARLSSTAAIFGLL